VIANVNMVVTTNVSAAVATRLSVVVDMGVSMVVTTNVVMSAESVMTNVIFQVSSYCLTSAYIAQVYYISRATEVNILNNVSNRKEDKNVYYDSAQDGYDNDHEHRYGGDREHRYGDDHEHMSGYKHKHGHEDGRDQGHDTLGENRLFIPRSENKAKMYS
jgi:hypothetical protein